MSRIMSGSARILSFDTWIKEVGNAMLAASPVPATVNTRTLAQKLYTEPKLELKSGEYVDNPHLGGNNLHALSNTLKAIK